MHEQNLNEIMTAHYQDLQIVAVEQNDYRTEFI